MLGFLEAETAFLIAHIFGAILGAGGAFTSDGMFMSSIKDGRITKTEMRFLGIGSRLVWTGLGVLIVSGICLVALQPEKYLSSDKFLAKISIVGVIVVNGLLFHVFHIPFLIKNLGVRLIASPVTTKRFGLVLVSGGISVASWISTIVLAMIKNPPWAYGEIMGVYGLAIVGAAFLLFAAKKQLLLVRRSS